MSQKLVKVYKNGENHFDLVLSRLRGNGELENVVTKSKVQQNEVVKFINLLLELD